LLPFSILSSFYLFPVKYLQAIPTKSVQFQSAAEKAKVFKDWKRFIEADFNKAKFTKRLYNHLIQHCSFIAHYNQGGFYSTYFEDPEDTLKFMKQFDTEQGCRSIEYGTTHWLNSKDYMNINTAMVELMEPYISEIYPKLRQRAREKKLGEIERLKREIETLK
jgi:hypothetical protein